MRVLVAVFTVALCFGAALAASENEGYKVLSPGAHEVADCRALQEAIKNVPVTLQSSPFFRDYAHKFAPEILDCASIAKAGAVGAGVQGAAAQIVKSVGQFPQTVKTYWSTLKGKFTGQQQALAPVQPKAGEEEKGLDDLWPALVIGAREPDLPCQDRDGSVDNCLMGVAGGGAAAAVAGIALDKQNIDQATVDMKTKNIEISKFSPQARASHFGHMSVAHSQTADRPGDTSVPGVVQWLQNPKAIPAGIYNFPRRAKAAAGIPQPTQQDIADAIVDLCLHYYTKAIGALQSTSIVDKQRHFTFHLARLGHTMMDSFSCSHCIRNADDKEFPIMFFTDYGAQSGEAHGKNGDELPGPDFNAPTNKGYLFGVSRVAKAMQIVLHSASVYSQKATKYVPVNKEFVAPSGEPDVAKAELKWFLESKVFRFAAPGFAKFSAKGCVTRDTVAPGKDAAICKIAQIKEFSGKPAGTVCPDRPVGWDKVFA